MLEFTGFVRPNVSPRLFAAFTFLMLIVMGKCYYMFITLCVSFREGVGNCYGYNSIVCLYVVYITTFRLLEAILYKRRLATKIFRAKVL